MNKSDGLLYARTSIHTRLDSHKRISSICRRSSMMEEPEFYFWETFVWQDDQIIDDLTHSGLDNIQDVAKLHLDYVKRTEEQS